MNAHKLFDEMDNAAKKYNKYFKWLKYFPKPEKKQRPYRIYDNGTGRHLRSKQHATGTGNLTNEAGVD